MKQIIIECKKFNEWDEKTQELILEKHSEIEIRNDWYENVYYDYQEKLKQLGFYDIEISFSGFWSQGDGASFTANLNICNYLKTLNTSKYNRLLKLINTGSLYLKGQVIRNGSRYVHENTVYFEIDDNLPYKYYNIPELIEELEREISTHVKSLCLDIYYSLQEEYESLTSEENVKQILIENDYEFDKEGNIR